jgi:tRNA G18 (ribose-2'-O)-methylase SpoU
MKTPITVVLENVRSAYNVGSIFRTSDAVNAQRVVCVGLTPYPKLVQSDPRLPHVAARAHRQIAKTALGAEVSVAFAYYPTTQEAIIKLRQGGHTIYALEQAKTSKGLFNFKPHFPCALIVGHETGGIKDLQGVDEVLEIPMRGSKESLNVAVAAGIALYHFTNQVKNKSAP